MSRMPSGAQYTLPPPGSMQQPPQPSSAPQTALYYPPPGSGPISLPHIPASSSHHYHDQGMYQQPYDRPPPTGGARSVPSWNTGPDGGPSQGFPPQPGPSRMGDSYAAYTQPSMRSTSSSSAGGRHQQQQQGAGWSSVHPAASAPMHSRADSGARNAVKLEDLVSQERSTRPNTGRSSTNGPGGLTSLPLSATQSSDNLKGASAHGMNDGSGGGGGGAGGASQAGPSEFIKKLYRMLEEESAQFGKGRPPGAKRDHGAKKGPVGWSRGGSTFVVWDMNDFTTKILPQTFRHSNFSSFVRQLNKYGFSKIKHVDEDTGTIKDNVWEFQHPNFVAGQKSELDSIKRKTVAPKKGGAGGAGGAAGDDEGTSPRGLTNEESGRMAEMESRVASLEDQLSKAMDEVQEARSREMGVVNILRDMIGHLGAVERGAAGSPRVMEPSPRIMSLYQQLDQISGVSSRYAPSFSQLPLPLPPQPTVMNYNPAPVRLAPVNGMASAGSTGMPPISSIPSSMGGVAPTAHTSPHTDGGSRHSDKPSPAGSTASRRRGSISQLVQGQPPQKEDVIEIPSTTNSVQPSSSDQTLYNGDPLEMTPIFGSTPGWMTDAPTGSSSMYNRKSSDGAAIRIMMEALQPSQPPSGVRFEDTQDPLDATPPKDTSQDAGMASSSITALPPNGDAAVAAAAGSNAVIEQSPFGTLVIPDGEQPSIHAPLVDTNPLRLRRSTVLRPHWTQTPRILVVEDDVVYRQLSSKFLEKFGCITETVEDAQGAVEKMNATKYDLVLMDIFFGPSMDGRKATSLIRQFDIYTPIISMTSNVQTQDVDSYLQSGMNDVLAKPFTKNGLFGILDKHLIHLKAIQLSAQVPRSLGLPPLSDQGVADAVATGAAQWGQGTTTTIVRNPLAAMGWSDETYSIVLQQFMATGAMPDANAITNGSINAIDALGSLGGSNGSGGGTGAIGTSVVFGDSSGFNRKRSIETLEDDWGTTPGSVNVATPNLVNANGMMGAAPGMMGGNGMMSSSTTSTPVANGRGAKKAKK